MTAIISRPTDTGQTAEPEHTKVRISDVHAGDFIATASGPVEVRHVEHDGSVVTLLLRDEKAAMKLCTYGADSLVHVLTSDAAEQAREQAAGRRRRAALTGSLLQLADWLDQSPNEPPVPQYGDFELSYYVSNHEAIADNAAGIARIKEIAEQIGGEYRNNGGTHHYASRSFGSASYRAIFIEREKPAADKPAAGAA